jgi:C4-dicarboxylate transporter, DctQ subunit
MALMVVLILTETMARYLFNSPLNWAIELPSYLQIVCTAFGLAYAQKMRSHIAVGLLEARIKNIKVLATFTSCLLVLYFIMVVFITTGIFFAFLDYVTEDRRSIIIQLPLMIPQGVILFGFILYGIQLIVDFIDEVQTARTGRTFGKSHGVLAEASNLKRAEGE